ncbi:MAG: sulfurtransferase TusA family protein [Candidatus Thermoplasmatota archaeon]
MKKSNKLDVLGETCPVPLVETRKAVRKSSPGDIIEVIGNHPESKEEIPMAVEELGLELLEIEENDEQWKIKIKIPEED